MAEREQIDHELDGVSGPQRPYVENAVRVAHHPEHGQRGSEVGRAVETTKDPASTMGR